MCCPEAVSSGSARAGYGTKRGLTGTMRCRIEADAAQSRSVGRLVEYSTVSGYPNWNWNSSFLLQFLCVHPVCCVCVVGVVGVCACRRNTNGQF
jgi:hypothetical protein